MRRVCCIALIVALGAAAYAELQNVEVYGRIDVRGRYYKNAFNNAVVPGGGPAPQVRIPAFLLPGRSIGERAGVTSIMDYDNRGADWKFVELVTTLGVKADFTDNVNAVIEFYDYEIMGRDFRSNYITGADFVTTTADDIEVLQSYIEMNEVLDQPLRLRIGRQRMRFDNGWLVSDEAAPTMRISWDAIRATYEVDAFVVDAWWSKLAENSPFEEDGDVDFYGIRGEYRAMEHLKLAAYWYWVRDARSINDTNLTWFGEWFEDLFGVDDYDVTNLHTVGIRAWGGYDAFDYNLNLSYQFGDADAIGSRFRPFGTYGAQDAEWDNWAGELELGYTFDVQWKPRVYLGGAYFEGEDNRSVSFREWLSPFSRPKASVSFNRLFSEGNYAPMVNDNGWMSNFSQVRGGVGFHPTEKVMVRLQLAKLWVNETFDWPAYFRVGRYRVPIAPNFSFWTTSSSDDLGWEASLVLRYAYTEDLTALLYYGHLFPGDAIQDGSYYFFNGNSFAGGTDKDHGDYLFLWLILKF